MTKLIWSIAFGLVAVAATQDFLAPSQAEEEASTTGMPRMLSVKDDGAPQLFAYRRVIIESPSIADNSAPFASSSFVAEAMGETRSSCAGSRRLMRRTASAMTSREHQR